MTTNTTNSQAAPEIDVEFVNLMSAYRHAESAEDHLKARRALVDYHEAKLAQAREDGFEEGLKAPDSAYLQIVERAKKAESRLAEIQRGVEGLTRYTPGLRWGVTGFEGGLSLVSRNEVLALLQPQGQADTSGLPG